MGMEAFADQARRELRATGETARTRTATTSVELTAQEAQIARLARDGLSNPEIGTRLFLSPAPDLRIQAHPVRVAKDNLTAVTGVWKGTFSKPMPDGTGGAIAPTGKAFALDMVTVGIWNRQGTMDEEFVFWDGQAFYQKIGLA
jgi:hypothetical protein